MRLCNNYKFSNINVNFLHYKHEENIQIVLSTLKSQWYIGYDCQIPYLTCKDIT